MELRILNVEYKKDFENNASDAYKTFEKNFTDTVSCFKVWNKTNFK